MTNPAAVEPALEQPASRSTRRALLGIGAVGAALAASRPVAAATQSDDDLARFVMGLELAARDLYRLGPSDEWESLAWQHEAYADRISGIIGVPASTRDAALYDRLEADFRAGDDAAALELENTLAATNANVLGLLDDAALLGAIASFVSAESRHAAVLAELSGAGLDAALTNPADPLAPEA